MSMRTVARYGRPLAASVAVAAAMWGGLTAATPLATSGLIHARTHDVTVTARPLRPAPDGTLTEALEISTGASSADQLDAVTADNGSTIALYHAKVSVGELPDLASCGGGTPSPAVVDDWLHYGPLLVPGRGSGPAQRAEATLTVSPAGTAPIPGTKVAITLYFADAGPLRVDLPVVSG